MSFFLSVGFAMLVQKKAQKNIVAVSTLLIN